MKRLLPLCFCLSMLLTSCSATGQSQAPTNSGVPESTLAPTEKPGAKSLQLDTFAIPTPPPMADCARDMGVPKPSGCRCPEDHTSVCDNHRCIGAYPTNGDPNQIGPWEYCPGQWDYFCKEDGHYDTCIGKPVIYLYPQHEEQVNVTLQIPGKITISNPQYPASGWQHLDVFPDGSFFFNGAKYHELFYESAVPTVSQPATGMVIQADHLVPVLTILTRQLGLNEQEQQEFLLYWLPKLDALHSPYILFSVLSPQTKDAIDHVTIAPKPDTTINFLVYFKPLANPISIAPLHLSAPPKRIGFTSVEWGGMIGQ